MGILSTALNISPSRLSRSDEPEMTGELYQALNRNLRDAMAWAQQFADWAYTQYIVADGPLPPEEELPGLLEIWLAEAADASPALRESLTEQLTALLSDELFLQELPGLLAPDDASQARLPLVLARIAALASR